MIAARVCVYVTVVALGDSYMLLEIRQVHLY